MKELLLEYYKSLDKLKAGINRIEDKIEDIKLSDKVDKYKLIEELLDELKIHVSMREDLKYVIKWLELGHEPNNWSGIPNLRVGEGVVAKSAN